MNDQYLAYQLACAEVIEKKELIKQCEEEMKILREQAMMEINNHNNMSVGPNHVNHNNNSAVSIHMMMSEE